MIRVLTTAAMILAGCGFIHLPPNTSGDPVSVNAHCGLDYITLEYEEKLWKFGGDVANANPPPGWEQDNTIYLEWVGDELIAHGPDGADYRLVERTEGRPSGCL